MKPKTINKVTGQNLLNVYEAKSDTNYIVKNTPELGILKSLGIIKNARIYKKLTHRLGGPVLLMVETCEVAIGKDVAEEIMVKETCVGFSGCQYSRKRGLQERNAGGA